ncbi:MAG: hypothetical protein ACRBDI_05485 [Alphaproteobacteria bacterium]
MTQEISPWDASGMKDNNKRFKARVYAFLENIVEDKPRHALFLNMLSMLEHLGSRKIMVSQMNKIMTQDTLQHLAEEARHAYFFKRNAERVAGKALDGWTDKNTMCRIPSAMYFGRMDAGITKTVGEEKAYGWVSLIIELRACWLYDIYQSVLEKSSDHMSLKSLLAEEDKHLAEMFGMCGDDYDTLKKLSAYETELFEKLWSTLEKNHSELKQTA